MSLLVVFPNLIHQLDILYILIYITLATKTFGGGCENGGVDSVVDGCICPPKFKGDKCQTYPYTDFFSEFLEENTNEQQQQQQPKTSITFQYTKNQFTHTDIEKCSLLNYPQAICSWRDYRSKNELYMKIANSMRQTPYSEDKIVRDLLKTYGPWNENDITLLNYFFTHDDSSDYQFKYSRPQYDRFNESATPNSLAYVLMVHDIDMEAFTTLFNHIYRPHNFYVIHIDQNFNNQEKLDSLNKFIDEKVGNQFKNIRILEDRFKNAWGSVGLVYSEVASYTKLFDMMLERDASEHSNSIFSHVINLSINDFPTKNVNELEAFLHSKDNLKTNFLDDDFARYNRLNKTFVNCGQSMGEIKFGFHNHNHKLRCGDANDVMKSINRLGYAEGSQWHFLSRQFVKYIISNIRPIERLFSIKFSFIPDENYFQITRSEWGGNKMLWNRWNYRYIPWHKGRLEVSSEEVPHVQKTRGLDTFFTRKVYTQKVKEEIIEKYLK